MPSKSYSKAQREEVRQKLLETALDLYSEHGIKNISLMDILKPVGISKPFFYTFFDSVQSFIIQVLDFQWTRIAAVIAELETHVSWTWDQKARILLDRLIHYQDHGLLVMTQEEELWVRARLSDEEYASFMQIQIGFFESLLELWGVPHKHCSAKVLGNMVLSMILTYSSAQKALPFLYLDMLEETSQAQVESLIAYLEKLKKDS